MALADLNGNAFYRKQCFLVCTEDPGWPEGGDRVPLNIDLPAPCSTEILYSCIEGYQLVIIPDTSISVKTCVGGQWSGGRPECHYNGKLYCGFNRFILYGY